MRVMPCNNAQNEWYQLPSAGLADFLIPVDSFQRNSSQAPASVSDTIWEINSCIRLIQHTFLVSWLYFATFCRFERWQWHVNSEVGLVSQGSGMEKNFMSRFSEPTRLFAVLRERHIAYFMAKLISRSKKKRRADASKHAENENVKFLREESIRSASWQFLCLGELIVMYPLSNRAPSGLNSCFQSQTIKLIITVFGWLTFADQ